MNRTRRGFSRVPLFLTCLAPCLLAGCAGQGTIQATAMAADARFYRPVRRTSQTPLAWPSDFPWAHSPTFRELVGSYFLQFSPATPENVRSLTDLKSIYMGEAAGSVPLLSMAMDPAANLIALELLRDFYGEETPIAVLFFGRRMDAYADADYKKGRPNADNYLRFAHDRGFFQGIVFCGLSETEMAVLELFNGVMEERNGDEGDSPMARLGRDQRIWLRIRMKRDPGWAALPDGLFVRAKGQPDDPEAEAVSFGSLFDDGVEAIKEHFKPTPHKPVALALIIDSDCFDRRDAPANELFYEDIAGILCDGKEKGLSDFLFRQAIERGIHVDTASLEEIAGTLRRAPAELYEEGMLLSLCAVSGLYPERDLQRMTAAIYHAIFHAVESGFLELPSDAFAKKSAEEEGG